MPSSRRRPPDAPQVLPYLYYRDAGTALDFLVSAFDFAEKDAVRDDEGRLWHANVSTGDGIVMIGPGMDEFGTVPVADTELVTARTFVYVDDVDAHYSRARLAGATIISEPGEQGPNRIYCAADCGGHQWIFGTPIATA